MKKTTILSVFALMASALLFNACSDNSSSSAGGVLQPGTSGEQFDPFASSTPNQDDSSQDPDEGLLPNEIVGLWKGLDTLYSYSEFTIEISADGSAVFKDETGEIELAFTFDENHSNLGDSDYYFAYDENPEVLMNIWINRSYSVFSVVDDYEIITDGEQFYFYDSLEIEKLLYF